MVTIKAPLEFKDEHVKEENIMANIAFYDVTCFGIERRRQS